ncbi:ATP-dependent DNA helicase Q1-like [Montipora capricornis]|uniref:ATP-dependent DNA helicase Q1-like n=1 Tax=Montipora capricornis TaxID=246305 RepID=UPI0035F1E7C1
MAVRIEDIDKAIAEVIGSFDGVEEVTAQQREGIANYMQRKDILSVLSTGYGKSLLFQLLPGICRALNTMGYTSYLRKAIILVICPLNALIESHMKELRQRSISCTCLSGNDADQDGACSGNSPSFLSTLRPLFLTISGGK